MTSFIDRHFRPLMLLLVAIGFVAVGLAMAQGQIDSDSTDETECKWIVKPTKQPNYDLRDKQGDRIIPLMPAPHHAVQYNECTGIAYGLTRMLDSEGADVFRPEKFDYEVDRLRAYNSVPRSPDCKWNVVATEFSQPSYQSEGLFPPTNAHALLSNECSSIVFSLEAIYYERWARGEQWLMLAVPYSNSPRAIGTEPLAILEQYQ